MVVRKKKTTRTKQLGERTHGHGDTKNRRGSGNRGGHGRAGSHKHKFSKYYMTFGIKVRMTGAPKGKAINVGQLCDQIEKWKRLGKMEEKDGLIIVDGKKIGISTLLGAGEVTADLLVRNIRVSEKARQKIEAHDGEIEDTFDKARGETTVADPSAGEGADA